MIIALSTTGGTPAEQIHDQIRGLITTGALAANERLPSVRQLAADLRVAPGTIAKVYKQLEEEQFVETRVGAGTRVSPHAAAVSKDVARAARKLTDICKRDNLELNEVLQVIRATW
ncbi:GntR family transcriptional regulator [Pseudarthrobacter enclensis]|uniref:DNA-binding transcriptional regulator YhcF (GntR family) n=1 Tax=Pseudarthrobacter enclensis TaxID=993070 RepID=A0ABT9RYP8_9MICC|nr:GntR family transcriptional regulator [Pseudarthrobacter enclensis]MDP9889394.1 DNA-binding transcriptional regulator YhcF (GntR family) [Pseudarthrobacter enclensis]